MKNVVFVAPYFLDATERFIAAAVRTEQANVGLVSCDPVAKLAPEISSKLAAYQQVPSIETQHLLEGVQSVGRQLGSVDKLLGMLEQIMVSLGEIREQLNIPGATAQVANHFRDKSLMKTVLRDAQLPCARHRLVADEADALRFASETGYPLIVKPPDGAGAKQTYRVEDQSSLLECLKTLHPSAHQPALLEEFILGKEHSFDSVMLNGRLVWHSMSYYYPNPLEVVQEPWIQWAVMVPRSHEGSGYEQIRSIAEPALQALGLQTGLSHMEWFQRPDGTIAISEVGARPPGAQFMTLLSYAHDIDMYRAWAELMIHDRFDAREKKYACGAAYLRGMGRGRVADVHGLQKIGRELGDLVVETKIPKAGQLPSSSYEGEGFIIVRHPETDVVKNALKQIVTNVRVELQEA